MHANSCMHSAATAASPICMQMASCLLFPLQFNCMPACVHAYNIVVLHACSCIACMHACVHACMHAGLLHALHACSCIILKCMHLYCMHALQYIYYYFYEFVLLRCIHTPCLAAAGLLHACSYMNVGLVAFLCMH